MIASSINRSQSSPKPSHPLTCTTATKSSYCVLQIIFSTRNSFAVFFLLFFLFFLRPRSSCAGTLGSPSAAAANRRGVPPRFPTRQRRDSDFTRTQLFYSSAKLHRLSTSVVQSTIFTHTGGFLHMWMVIALAAWQEHISRK